MRVEREHNSPTLVVFRLVPLFWFDFLVLFSALFSFSFCLSLSLSTLNNRLNPGSLMLGPSSPGPLSPSAVSVSDVPLAP